MAFDLAAEIQDEVANGADMTKGEEGGGTYTPPAAGAANARFVAYYEVGQHEEDEFGANGQKTGGKRNRDKVHLVFELSGPKHEPREGKDGVKIPHRITVKETLSMNVKANFFKLFAKMNMAHGGTYKHMAQLLGKEFKVTVFHKKATINGKEVIFANLKGSDKTTPIGDGYEVRRAEREDEEGNMVPVKVAPAITAIQGFIWNRASKPMWDSIYIAGEYEAKYDDKEPTKLVRPAKSKNVIQELIMKAVNFNEIVEKIGVDTSTLNLEAEKPARVTQDPAAAALSDNDDDIPF